VKEICIYSSSPDNGISHSELLGHAIGSNQHLFAVFIKPSYLKPG
jgi:hypothetical protein